MREESRSYPQLLTERIDATRWGAWLLLAWVSFLVLVTTLIGIHEFVAPVPLFSSGQFEHLPALAYAADLAIHIYLLYRITAFITGRADTETLYAEVVDHPMWLYLFVTSALLFVA